MMASLDAFEITLRGKSCHAAMPESGADPIVAAAQLIMALQTIPSRRLSPQDSAVVSITQINGGEAINVLPDTVVLRGTFRCLSNRVRARVRELIESYVATQPQVSDVQGEISWFPGYPVTKTMRCRRSRCARWPSPLSARKRCAGIRRRRWPPKILPACWRPVRGLFLDRHRRRNPVEAAA